MIDKLAIKTLHPKNINKNNYTTLRYKQGVTSEYHFM